jgi:hypothetical protein
MEILFQTENTMLKEEGVGQLFLYFKDTKIEFHEGMDYTMAIPFADLDHAELKEIAQAILRWVEPNDSIE